MLSFGEPIASADNIGAGWQYVECGLNNFDFPAGNDAPFWHERRPIRPGYLMDTVIKYPLTSICADTEILLNQKVTEYEGDLIKYEWVTPLDINGTLATYIGGYSLSNPLPHHTPPGFDIDSLTGAIKLKAAAPITPTTGPEIYVVAIKATEFRVDTVVISGVLTPITREIGYVIRHLTILVEPASTCPSNDFGLTTTQKNVACNDTSFVIDVNELFQCVSVDSNASFLKLSDSTTGAIIPIHSASVGNCSNDLADDFEVKLNAPLSAGTYILTTVIGADGNTILSECGIDLPQLQDTVIITVDSIEVPALLGSDDGSGGYLPYLNGICGTSSFEIVFDTPVDCSTIDVLGSDFVLIDSTGTVPTINIITSVLPTACIDGLTDGVTVNFTTHFTLEIMDCC